MTNIAYITGDLFTTDIPVIIHGCNKQGKFRSGVAGVIRKKYPEAYLAYMKTYNNGNLRLGELICVYSNGKFIVNAITQEFYGYDGKQYVSYDAIRSIFKQINTDMLKMKDPRIALPLIGAGLGGGSWSIISKIIEEETTNCIPVIYTLDGIIPN